MGHIELLPEGAYYARCINTGGYVVSLKWGQVYVAYDLPDPELADELRVVDETGEDYIYSRSMFQRVDLPF